MFQKIPNYIKYIFTNVFSLFVFVVFFRGFFYLFFADLENIPTEEIQKAISLGIRFDLKLRFTFKTRFDLRLADF